MNREKVWESVQKLEVETKLSAWIFKVDDHFYQVCEYGGIYGMPEQTSIWPCTRRGKRLIPDSIFSTPRKNYKVCIEAFLDFLEEPEESEN